MEDVIGGMGGTGKVGGVTGSEVLNTGIRGTGKVGVVTGCEVLGSTGSGGTSKVVDSVILGMSPT
jgi:hypothetical protein